MARLVDRIMENPAKSGGLFVMVLTTAAVVSNALFLQHARHPEPWFATRPGPVAVAPGTDAVIVPDPRPRGTPPVDPPMPRLQPEPPPPAPAAEKPVPTQTLIADLQKALSERGLYRGKIDGISGSRTRAAFSAYEESQGLPVTGQPSTVLLDHIATASIAPAEPAPAPAAAPSPPATVAVEALPPPADAAPTPPADAVAVTEARDEIDDLLSYPSGTAEPATVTSVSAEPEPPPAPAVAPPQLASAPTPVAAPTVDYGAQRTLSVQKALNQIGYGPVPENGVAGEGTVAAIRRFELDNGLPITGAAGDTVIERLVAIGAMAAA